MPLVSARLDLLLLPADPETVVADAVLDRLLALAVAGRPAEDVVVGGYADVRLDRPGRVVFYANQQGGFRVRCPRSGEDLVRGFTAAMRAWRAGGARVLRCDSCGQAHPLEALAFAPPAGFGSFAIVFSDARGPDLRPAARARIEAAVGPMRTVWRRVSG